MDTQNQTKVASKTLWLALISLIVVFGVLDFLFLTHNFDKHAYFDWENAPVFYGAVGFLSSVIVLIIAKHVVAPVILREDNNDV